MSLTDGSIFPGENFVKESTVRKAIFQELAPELLADQLLMDHVNRYVFNAKQKNELTRNRTMVEQHLSKYQKQLDSDKLATLMILIDGMQVAAQNWGLSDNNALDNWLALKKEEAMDKMNHKQLKNLAKEKTNHLGFLAKENGG